MSEKPLILIANDDGVEAKGIKVLTRLMCQLGQVVVVAPDGARSGSSCAITTHGTVRLNRLSQAPGLQVYSCSGTPTDCVKLALEKVIGRKPDLMVSGINHGDNTSVSVHYSGTLGAVYEAKAAIIASGTLLSTLLFVQKNELAHIRELQYYNTGKFMDGKKDGTPFKGVRKEK